MAWQMPSCSAKVYRGALPAPVPALHASPPPPLSRRRGLLGGARGRAESAVGALTARSAEGGRGGPRRGGRARRTSARRAWDGGSRVVGRVLGPPAGGEGRVRRG